MRAFGLIRDVDVVENRGGRVVERARFLAVKRLEERVVDVVRDGFGVVGFELERFVLCARDYVWQGVVSCHEGLVLRALRRGKPLLMYVLKHDVFYVFSPKRVLEEGRINLRGGVRMLNFPVRLGKNLDKLVGGGLSG